MNLTFLTRDRGDWPWYPWWGLLTGTTKERWKLAYRLARAERDAAAWAIKWNGKLVEML